MKILALMSTGTASLVQDAAEERKRMALLPVRHGHKYRPGMSDELPVLVRAGDGHTTTPNYGWSSPNKREARRASRCRPLSAKAARINRKGRRYENVFFHIVITRRSRPGWCNCIRPLKAQCINSVVNGTGCLTRQDREGRAARKIKWIDGL